MSKRPGDGWRQARLHRRVRVQVADERVISNRDSSDLTACVSDRAQVIERTAVFRNSDLIAIQIKHLNGTVGDDRQILLRLIPQDRMDKSISKGSC